MDLNHLVLVALLGKRFIAPERINSLSARRACIVDGGRVRSRLLREARARVRTWRRSECSGA